MSKFKIITLHNIQRIARRIFMNSLLQKRDKFLLFWNCYNTLRNWPRARRRLHLSEVDHVGQKLRLRRARWEMVGRRGWRFGAAMRPSRRATRLSKIIINCPVTITCFTGGFRLTASTYISPQRITVVAIFPLSLFGGFWIRGFVWWGVRFAVIRSNRTWNQDILVKISS